MINHPNRSKKVRALGPFDLHFGHDYVRVLKAGGTTDDLVAQVYGDDEKQTRQHALLFFAAPDLLKALRAVRHHLMNFYDPTEDANNAIMHEAGLSIELADAAIAKALGN